MALYANECRFWTLHDLIHRGLDPQGDASATCKALAYHYIRGNAWHGNHVFFNYEYYMDQINQGKSGQLLVIRTEHMVDDWNGIEQRLATGSSSSWNAATADDFAAKNVGSNKNAADEAPLNERATQLLCWSLCREIQVYKKILQRASNLTPDQVEESFQELYQTCPNQAAKRSCDEYD